MTAADWLLVAELAASVWMAALIWLVQLLVYPAFADVDPARWAAHHARHSRRITWLVAPPMLVQLAAPTLLLFVAEPAGVARALLVVLLALAALTWAITAAHSAPSHGRMSAACTPDELGVLLRGNRVRTAAWTLLAIGAVWALAQH